MPFLVQYYLFYNDNSFLFLFIWKAERYISHLLLYSPDAHKSQSWVRLKLGPWSSSSHVSHSGGKDPGTWSVILLPSQVACQQVTGSRAVSQTRYSGPGRRHHRGILTIAPAPLQPCWRSEWVIVSPQASVSPLRINATCPTKRKAWNTSTGLCAALIMPYATYTWP